MNSFVYDIPVKVYFGAGQLEHLGPELARFGKKVLLTYGGGSIKKSGLYQRVTEQIRKAGLTLYELGGIAPNPRVESVRRGAWLCKQEGIDVLLAVGGGSTIDATKFMAAGACTEADPWDFFTENAPIDRALPIVTVLTLAATGSEMDNSGVISNPDTRDKLARVAPPVLPKVSFLDPTNTYSVSPYQTACGAVDIMSHTFEAYFTPEEDLFFLDCVMEGLLKTVVKFAPVAMAHPDDYEARANLMWASSWAINGFVAGGKRQDWSCHPIEHELSALYDITHGLGLAILTPRWLRWCLNEQTAPRIARFAVNVMGTDPALDPETAALDGIRRLETFFYDTLGLASTLSELGIRPEDYPLMAQKACAGGELRGFRTLRPADVEEILRMCG